MQQPGVTFAVWESVFMKQRGPFSLFSFFFYSRLPSLHRLMMQKSTCCRFAERRGPSAWIICMYTHNTIRNSRRWREEEEQIRQTHKDRIGKSPFFHSPSLCFPSYLQIFQTKRRFTKKSKVFAKTKKVYHKNLQNLQLGTQVLHFFSAANPPSHTHTS